MVRSFNILLGLSQRENGKGGIPGSKEDKSMSQVKETLSCLFFVCLFYQQREREQGVHI